MCGPERLGKLGERVLNLMDDMANWGQRKYVPSKQVPRVRNGLGIAIISTSQGIMTDREARKRGVGGEILCEVW